MQAIRNARATLAAAGIALGQDFKTLSRDQLVAIVAEAAKVYREKYGKPMPADNGAYVRKRYGLLQRRAGNQ